TDTVLDGEICCLDKDGKSVFDDLMFRRATCFFYAFDVLFLKGEDVRNLPLIERKSLLRSLIPRRRSRLLYVDHIDKRGCDLFEQACELDLEGVVAKRRTSTYIADERPSPHWIKIKNPTYSQAEGRDEMFDVFSGREPRREVTSVARNDRTGKTV